MNFHFRASRQLEKLECERKSLSLQLKDHTSKLEGTALFKVEFRLNLLNLKLSFLFSFVCETPRKYQ